MISMEYSICGFRVYIYTKLQHLQIQKCKKPSDFCVWNILSVGFAYIYIYEIVSRIAAST